MHHDEDRDLGPGNFKVAHFDRIHASIHAIYKVTSRHSASVHQKNVEISREKKTDRIGGMFNQLFTPKGDTHVVDSRDARCADKAPVQIWAIGNKGKYGALRTTKVKSRQNTVSTHLFF